MTTERKGTTVKQLREALNALAADFDLDNLEVQVWLPGSYIYLESPQGPVRPFVRGNKVMLEGNLMPGSALE